jgi:hypothetical protein
MTEHDDFVIGDLADTEGGEDVRDADVESLAEEIFAPTDEPEEITAEEASHTDIPAEPTEVEDSHLTVTVCDVCLELNLTHSTSVIRCARCGQAFCFHFASAVDVQYCVNCLSDISVSKSAITKTYEHKNAQGDTVFYRRRAREIQIKGLDWLFAQRKIVELSDLELDLSIEYHRNILSLMCIEQEQRRTAKMHRYANVKIHITPSVIDVSHTTTTTTVKKTRTVSKTKAQEQLAALLKNMAAKGMTMDKIAAMLKKA